MPKNINKTSYFWLIIIILAGFLLRVCYLNKYDFWFDESVFLLVAKYFSIKDITVYLGSTSTSPPLFYILLRFWSFLCKDDSCWRLLPLIFGLLSIFIIYLLGKEVFNKKTGLISAFLLSISPYHIYYSREVTAYTLTVFLALISLYFFVKLLNENRLFFWAWYSFFSLLLLYSHSLGLIILIAEDIYLISSRKYRGLFSKALISQLAILLCYSPWIYVITYQITTLKILTHFFWVTKPSKEIMLYTFNIFNLGYNATNTEYFLGIIIFFPIFLFGIYKGLKNKLPMPLILSLLFLPIIIIITISSLLKQGSISLHRAFISISPLYYIVIANGLTNLKHRYSAILLSSIALLSIFAIKNYYDDIIPLPSNPYHQGVFAKKENKAAADYIKQGFSKGDAIVHTSRATSLPFAFYHHNRLEQKWVAAANDPDWLHWKNTIAKSPYSYNYNKLNSAYGNGISNLSKDYKRIWLVYSGWELESKDSREIKVWLDNNFEIIKQRKFRGIDICLYQTAITKRLN